MNRSKQTIYTRSDHQTWQNFFAKMRQIWQDHHDLIHPMYLDHLDVLEPFTDQIPTAKDLSEILAPLGWRASYVDGYAPGWVIARMLHKRIMPIARYLRPQNEVEFAREPDLIHDVFGHLPILFNAEYRQLLAQWAAAASRVAITLADQTNYNLNKLLVGSQSRSRATMEHLERAAGHLAQYFMEQPSPALVLDKAYFWIFEFGIVRNHSQTQVFGAGLMSSMNEIKKLARRSPESLVKYLPLNRQNLLRSSEIAALQKDYLCSEQLSDCHQLISQLSDRPQKLNLLQVAH